MRFKTWEKWYWGIFISLAALVVVGACTTKEVEITVFGSKRIYTEFNDRLKAGLITAAVIIGVALVIWLIIRLFSRED